MIRNFLASGQLGKLASFVSPAFFDVMPASALWGRAKRLYSKSKDREAFRQAVATRSETLRERLSQVQLCATNSAQTSVSSSRSLDAPTRASTIAELYFLQLFDEHATLLDLRATAFAADETGLIWRPSPWIADWSPEFIEPLRMIYRGFYAHDDQAFHSGLAALSLEHSADLFRQHFGGDQAEVRFHTADFVDTFHKVFVRCKETGTSLHADFLPLGIYLAALYDHLQELNVPVNVAAAYERATNNSAAARESVPIHV
jgi:hypothetical protein